MRMPATGTRFEQPGINKWQPTLTSHDPNPPITIDNAPAPPATSTKKRLLLLKVGK